jgi:hypothetical protein
MCVCGSLILLIPTVRGTGNRKIGTDGAVAHSFKAAKDPARRAEIAKYIALGVLSSVSIEPGVTNELSSHGSLRKEHA